MTVRPAASIVRFTDRHDLAVWGCLYQKNAVELYISIFLNPELDLEEVGLTEIDECFRSVMPYADLTRYIELTVLGLYNRRWWGMTDGICCLRTLRSVLDWGHADVTQSGDVPVFEIEPIVFVANPEFVWRDTIDSASLSEQTCIRGVLGQDRYETVRDEAIFDGSTESWRVRFGDVCFRSLLPLFSSASRHSGFCAKSICRSTITGHVKPIGPQPKSWRAMTKACLNRVFESLRFPSLD